MIPLISAYCRSAEDKSKLRNTYSLQKNCNEILKRIITHSSNFTKCGAVWCGAMCTQIPISSSPLRLPKVKIIGNTWLLFQVSCWFPLKEKSIYSRIHTRMNPPIQLSFTRHQINQMNNNIILKHKRTMLQFQLILMTHELTDKKINLIKDWISRKIKQVNLQPYQV